MTYLDFFKVQNQFNKILAEMQCDLRYPVDFNQEAINGLLEMPEFQELQQLGKQQTVAVGMKLQNA